MPSAEAGGVGVVRPFRQARQTGVCPGGAIGGAGGIAAIGCNQDHQGIGRCRRRSGDGARRVVNRAIVAARAHIPRITGSDDTREAMNPTRRMVSRVGDDRRRIAAQGALPE